MTKSPARTYSGQTMESNVENDMSDQEYAGHLLESLSDENLPLIDFDRLTDWIRRQQSAHLKHHAAQSELEALREDYRLRIAGMLKAITVADRKRDRQRSALQEIESLQSMTGEELIDCYRKTSARFRDMFPTTLRRPAPGASGGGSKNDYSVFK